MSGRRRLYSRLSSRVSRGSVFRCANQLCRRVSRTSFHAHAPRHVRLGLLVAVWRPQRRRSPQPSPAQSQRQQRRLRTGERVSVCVQLLASRRCVFDFSASSSRTHPFRVSGRISTCRAVASGAGANNLITVCRRRREWCVCVATLMNVSSFHHSARLPARDQKILKVSLRPVCT